MIALLTFFICFIFYILSSATNAKQLPLFIHSAETKELNCARFLQQTIIKSNGANRNEDLSEYRLNRVLFPDTEEWDSFKMDCESIFNRTYFQREDLYPDEKEFPLAFARTVYKDYRLIEMELGSSYAPQNYYCYALDSNSSPMFHARMKSLANCFPNVFLTTREYIMDSAGHNVTQSELECMKLLSNPSYKWKYLVSIGNHDIAMKTNQELIQVFKWLNGTNDILMAKVPAERVNPNVNWSFDALKLFKNESRNIQPYNGFEPKMSLARDRSTVSLSREAVDFIINELQVDKFLGALEWKTWETNELFMGSLDTADAIGLPGGFTSRCLQDEVPDYFISRYGIPKGLYCATEFWHNDWCIFGMENLGEFQYSPYLFANKFQPDKDFGAIACWHEYLFNRTHLERGTLRLDPKKYTDVPHVRFNRQRKEEGSKFDSHKFVCQSTGKTNMKMSSILIVLILLLPKVLA